MNSNPLISIIVPVYNSSAYLKRCVDSLTAQTYRNIEIILVDDGSNDEITSVMCDNIASRDERIRVFHKENGGTSSARNYGLDRMEGQYAGFIDSDDYVEPWMFEHLVRSALATGALVTQIGRDEVSFDGKSLPDICTPPQKEEHIPPEKFLEELLLHRGDCSFCTKLVEREFMDGFRFPRGRLNEDFLLCLEMIPEMGDLVSVPGYAYHVCYSRESNTRSENRQAFSRVYIDIVENSNYALRLVGRDYPELSLQAMRFALFQRLEYLLHIPVGMMRRDNEFYMEVVGFVREHFGDVVSNPYLTARNKVYLLLLGTAPATVRKIHKLIRG